MRHPGKVTEIKILELNRKRKNHFDFRRIIKPEFFTDRSTKLIYKVILDYFNRRNKLRISISDLRSILNVKIEDQELLAEVRLILRKMKRYSNRIDEELVRNLAIEWSRKSLAKQALYEGVESLDSEDGIDIPYILNKFEEASSLGFSEDEAYEYIDNLDDRLEKNIMTNPVPLLIPDIDDSLEGGLDVGELGIFVGPTHRGKTRSLVNVGSTALSLGKVVAHIIVCDSTVKRIGRRYDSCLSNKLFSRLKDKCDLIKNPLTRLKKRGARLIIKEFDKFAPTPNDIRIFLINYIQRKKIKLDLIIIDYLDEVRSIRNLKDPRHESREVSSSVRRLGAEFGCPVWTASQGNRKSMSKRTVDLDDVAEDIWKVNQADVVITLNQTEEEKEESIIRYKLAKARRENFIPKTITLEITPAGKIYDPVMRSMKL